MKPPKTPKKGGSVPASASAGSSKVKKNINGSPIKGRAVYPSGGVIESFATAASDIIISIVSKKGSDPKQGAYMKPIVDCWKSSNDISQDWYIDSVLPRRDLGNEPMKATVGRPYDWMCFVTLRGNPLETPSEIGQKLAASFTSFSTPEFHRSFQFVGDITGPSPGALNEYLLDTDVLIYLQKVYYGVKKDDLFEDDEILAAFFGTPEEGRRILNGLTEEEWNGQMWY